jgi:hypothetical protein
MKKRVSLKPLTTSADDMSGFTRAGNPVMEGPDNYDLLCSGCGAVVGDGVAPQRLADQIVAPIGAYIACPDCAALSAIPSRRPS